MFTTSKKDELTLSEKMSAAVQKYSVPVAEESQLVLQTRFEYIQYRDAIIRRQATHKPLRAGMAEKFAIAEQNYRQALGMGQ